jgi:hypothetical protein
MVIAVLVLREKVKPSVGISVEEAASYVAAANWFTDWRPRDGDGDTLIRYWWTNYPPSSISL